MCCSKKEERNASEVLNVLIHRRICRGTVRSVGDDSEHSYAVQQDLEGSKGGEGSMETEHTVVSNVALRNVRSEGMRTVLLNVLAKNKTRLSRQL
jgi:hypothetical protein